MITVREATPGDAATISRFLAECAVAHPARGATPDPAWVRDVMFADASICRLVIATDSDRPVGFALWRPTYDYLFGMRGGEVVWMFVEDRHRGLGVAAALLARVCADVLTDGGKFLWGSYQKAIVGKFYERMAVTRPDTWVGLPTSQVELLAKLAGRPPKDIARALRKGSASKLSSER